MNSYISDDGKLVEHKPSNIIDVADMDKANTPTTKQNAHRKRSEEAHERWEMVIKMVQEGKSNKEIAEKAGYAAKSVPNIINKLKRLGYNIPER